MLNPGRCPHLALLAAVVLLLTGLLGCNRGDSAEQATASPIPNTGPATDGGASRQLDLVDAEGLRQTIDSARGKVLLLNVWASWCGPCAAEFGALKGLHEDFRGEPLEIVALSLDDLVVRDLPVRRFLAQTDPSFRIIVRGAIDDGALRAILDPGWDGQVPTTFVFDRTGKLRQYLVGAQSQVSFEQIVRPLL